MLPKMIAQMMVSGATAIGRAVRKAAQEHMSQQRVAPQATASKSEHDAARKQTSSNAQLGITFDEATKILNVDKHQLDTEQIQKNFEHLFSVNDKTKGGSFYIQSKVVRAKERIDAELESRGITTEKVETENESFTQQTDDKSEQKPPS